MPSIGQTWILASIGAVVEMGVLSTLKRLLMESKLPCFIAPLCTKLFHVILGSGGEYEDADELEQMRHWDPMTEDYLSERNSMMVDVDDPCVALTGYSEYSYRQYIITFADQSYA
jgi:hypothetical protein